MSDTTRISTDQSSNGHVDDAPHFCSACGHALADGPFCPACGHPVPDSHPAAGTAESGEPDSEKTTEQPVAAASTHDEPAKVAAAAPASAAPASAATTPAAADEGMTIHLRHPLVLVGIALVLLAAIGAGLWWNSSRNDDRSKQDAAAAIASYRSDIKDAYEPVRTANIALSRELSDLSGTNRTAAMNANEDALDATTAAIGAINALDAPKGAGDLEGDAKDILELERSYLEQVIRVLESPGSTAAAQVPSFAANLTRSIGGADSTVFGTSDQVGGVSDLTRWAPVAARKLKAAREKKQAEVDAQSQQAAANTGGGTTSTGNPFTNGRDCGSGVYAGPNTSCEFAFNVRDAYWSQPGAVTTVRVYSPVTNNVYTMNCAPSGWGVTCTGGNNASVAF